MGSTQSCFRVILVNSNPATIMTDPELADATYIEPLTVEVLERIIDAERPDALLPTVGGQTGLNLGVALAEGGRRGQPPAAGRKALHAPQPPGAVLAALEPELGRQSAAPKIVRRQPHVAGQGARSGLGARSAAPRVDPRDRERGDQGEISAFVPGHDQRHAREADAHVALNRLMKYSQLQQTFGVNMIALVNGQPRVLPLKRILVLYIEHRRDVVLRRTRFEGSRGSTPSTAGTSVGEGR